MEQLLFAFKNHINWPALLFSILCVRLAPGVFATDLIYLKLQYHGIFAAAVSDTMTRPKMHTSGKIVKTEPTFC